MKASRKWTRGGGEGKAGEGRGREREKRLPAKVMKSPNGHRGNTFCDVRVTGQRSLPQAVFGFDRVSTG